MDLADDFRQFDPLPNTDWAVAHACVCVCVW